MTSFPFALPPAQARRLRRAVALLCLAALCCALLSACALPGLGQSAPASGSADTSADSSAPAPDNDPGLVEESPGRYVATTRKGVDELYTTERLSDDAYSLLNSLLGGAVSTPYRQPVNISAFRLVYDEATVTTDYRLDFTFTVAQSELASLPVGAHEKALFDGAFAALLPPGDMPSPKLGAFASDPAVLRVITWLNETGFYNVPAYGELQSYEPVLGYLCIQAGLFIPVEDFIAAAQQQFGIEPTPARLATLARHTSTQDGQQVISAGSLRGRDLAYEVLACTREGDVSTVVLQFYVDKGYLIPSLRVTYRVRDDGSFLEWRAENHSGSPYGLTYSDDNWEEALEFTGIDALAQYVAENPDTAYTANSALQFLQLNKEMLAQNMGPNYRDGMLDDLATVRIDPETCTVRYAPLRYSAALEFDVTESGMKTLPTGHYSIHIFDGMVGISVDDTANAPTPISAPGTQTLEMFLNYADTGVLPQTCSADALSVVTLDYLYRNAPFCTPTTRFSLEEVQAAAALYLGVKGLVPPSFFRDEAQGGYYTPGHGGRSTEHTIKSYTGTRADFTATVQFFTDPLHLVPSQLVQYRLQLVNGDYAITEATVLEESPWEHWHASL